MLWEMWGVRGTRRLKILIYTETLGLWVLRLQGMLLFTLLRLCPNPFMTIIPLLNMHPLKVYRSLFNNSFKLLYYQKNILVSFININIFILVFGYIFKYLFTLY